MLNNTINTLPVALSSLKIPVALICGLLLSVPAAAQVFPGGGQIPRTVVIDTHGYVSGQLSRIGRESTFNSVFSQIFIGQMLLGSHSASFITYGGLPLSLDANPWPFCFEKDDYELLEDYIGHDVIVEFKTPRSLALLSCSAIAEFVAIYPVDRYHAVDEPYLEGRIGTLDIEVSHGVEYGRITNAVKNESVSRQYYMTVQVSGSGNQFSHFITTDRKLYRYAVENLKSAAMVKIHYSGRLSGRNAFNRLHVRAIEVVDGDGLE